ncbi:hypothetical protein AGMMS50262_06880 [Bacteroidia bacterium]|nr:hypothetical protein AGMMS50262_06880 [Bacteroidia bacterium]
MKKLSCLTVLLFFACHLPAKTATNSIFRELYSVLENKAMYSADKEERIHDIKKGLNIPELTDNQLYTINNQLYAEFYIYQTDSAIYYLHHNLQIAKKLKNTEYIYETKLNLAYMYWQTARFFESIDMLESLDRSQFVHLPETLFYNYLEAYKRLYRYYAESQVDKRNDFFRKSNNYRDSLLNILSPGSKTFQILSAEKLTDEDKTTEAKAILTDLLSYSLTEDHDRAILNSILANIYKKEGNIAMQKKYFAISAICDIKNAIKENTSTQALALILFQEGDIDNAYKCVQSSMEDAIFCNSRFRTYEITKIFPIINTAYQAKVGKQQKELKIYLLLVSILSLFLVIAVVYVYRQMQRIVRIRKELHRTNVKLSKLNEDLQESNLKLHHLNNDLEDVNRKLSETNLVKETYLGKFIDLCSNYIEKLDNYRRNLNRIAGAGKLEELYKALKSTTFVEEELKDFHINFDETFLRIYPTFIEEFNALFPKEEKQTVKPGELLNTELRIYALIRLGINDSSKIAVFLRYSITTVYTYRSKLKNKSLFKDSLEEQIMKIGN